MYARKKISAENVAPKGLEGGLENQLPGKTLQGKVKKVKRVVTVGQVKRPALGDIANAEHEKLNITDGKKIPIALKARVKPERSNSVVLKANAKPTALLQPPAKSLVAAKKKVTEKAVQKVAPVKNIKKKTVQAPEEEILSHDIDLDGSVVLDRVEEDISVIEEGDELLAFDSESYKDIYHVSIYAQDIFKYYKNREKMFDIPPYMSSEYPVSASMRAILVDWMVEIQENFELNHETLYLGVKLTDLYLSRTVVTKDDLQLVGAVSLFVASKFDEQRYPLIEDFTYVCDNAFDARSFLQMEMDLLRQVDFDLGIPLSYRFLRRYAKVGKLSIETLTLARFMLELSLMSAEFISIRDSKVAAAALYLAMKMRREGKWAGDLIKGSGYELADFKQVVVSLNTMMLSPKSAQLKNSRGKYSHRVFYEVAKIPTIKNDKLFL